MSWQRLTARKPAVISHVNKILHHDICAYLEKCYYSQTQTLNRTPFISIRTIAADPEAIHYEVASMEVTARTIGRPYYQSFWVKGVERMSKPMDHPVVMSRTWLQPRAYDSLHWLSLFEIFDDTHDRDKMTAAAVSRWYPNEAELEKESTQLR